MAPNDEHSTSGNPTLSGYPLHEDQNTMPANVQDQTLLKALQHLIVRVMDPKQHNDTTHTSQMHLGPEAGKLITALQEFVSSIIMRSQPGTLGGMEVNLNEEENDVQGGNPGGYGTDESLPEGFSLMNVSSTEPDEDEIMVLDSISRDVGIKSKSPKTTFQEKLLRALREHIFNMMPIRLLCFEPRGESSLKITLLERGAIYSRLASALQNKTYEEEFYAQEKAWFDDIVIMETDQEIIERLISKYARYAILSHTWLRTGPGEVTFSDWNKGLLDPKNPGYRKLNNFCKTAWKEHRFAFGWMDTICINKDSSSELDESIRSMYNWYRRAALCIIHLAETETLSDMYLDPWFTRGWTLQELLAPTVIKFYSSHWQRFSNHSDNDKINAEIAEQIELATTISRKELEDIREAPISRRMQLAATREVTREEDTAYSLMGIFDISISTAYGEGAPRAFLRLLQEILVSSKDVLEILNWAGELPPSQAYNSRILPSSPKFYTNCSSNQSLTLTWPTEPLMLSHLGLRVPVILMPGISIQRPAPVYDLIGDYDATVDISPVGDYKYIPTTYNLLDNRISGRDGWKDNAWFQITFAVFNFSGAPDVIYLPKTCIAIGMLCNEDDGEVSATGVMNTIETRDPIVFGLSRRTVVDEVWSAQCWRAFLACPT